MATQQHPRSSKPQKQTTAALRRRTAPLVLLLAVLAAAAVSAVSADAADAGVFAVGSFAVDMTLTPATKNRKAGPNSTVGPVPAGVAWDGTSLWSAAGGAIDTVNLVRWSSTGKLMKAKHTPHLDIRAVWTQSPGPKAPLFADVYDDDMVYVQASDGKFEATGVNLHGATKDNDSPVLFRPSSLTEDPAAGVLVAHDGAGTLLEFDAADGQFVRDVPLTNYGSEPGETTWPAYTRFAVAAGVGGSDDAFYYLTYASGRVHAWDEFGERVGAADLEGAGGDEMACHSFSYAHEHAWVLDTATGAWKGYKLTFNDPAPRKAAAAAAAAQEAEEAAAAARAAAAAEAEVAAAAAAAAAGSGEEGVGGLGLNAAAGDKGACPIAVE